MQLDTKAVTAWLKGQRAADARIEQERRSFLQNLGSEEALRIYCSLTQKTQAWGNTPSPLLVKVREVLRRYEAASRGSR